MERLTADLSSVVTCDRGQLYLEHDGHAIARSTRWSTLDAVDHRGHVSHGVLVGSNLLLAIGELVVGLSCVGFRIGCVVFDSGDTLELEHHATSPSLRSNDGCYDSSVQYQPTYLVVFDRVVPAEHRLCGGLCSLSASATAWASGDCRHSVRSTLWIGDLAAVVSCLI